MKKSFFIGYYCSVMIMMVISVVTNIFDFQLKVILLLSEAGETSFNINICCSPLVLLYFMKMSRLVLISFSLGS